MPIGTVAKTEERFDLKTLLPDGFVIIRRMTYGEKLARQDDIMQMRASMEDKTVQMSMLNKKAALSDFGNLILDHNITDENERKLNFKDAKDVFALDPRVGEEIAVYIDGINSFEDTEFTKN